MSPLKKLLEDRRSRLLIEISIHLLVWLFLFSAVNINWSQDWFDITLRPRRPAPLMLIAFFLFFNLHTFWLVPAFLKKDRWLAYIFFSTLLFAGSELVRAVLVSVFRLQTPSALFPDTLFTRDSFLFGAPGAASYALILSALYWIIKEMYQHRIRSQELKTLKVSRELDILKGQMNPHFLFNNLNTLDNLIDDQNETAKEYLYALSSVYRAYLNNMGKDLIPLQQEWDLLDDYLHLLSIRFLDAYRFEKKNNLGSLMDYQIPPGTLQVLIENVIKHNRGSNSEPLLCTIDIDASGITVRNQIRSKATALKSGIGLQNIKRRFQLMSDEQVRISQGDHFEVVLPLIGKKSAK